MDIKKEKTEADIIVDNIISKLNIYMEKNNQTLFNLATSLGFAYQPFYRLIKNRNIPNIASLITMSRHFGYTVEELVSDKIIVEINIYNNIADLSLKHAVSRAKIYIPVDKYMPLINKSFIGIKQRNTTLSTIDLCDIYTLEDHIHLDGNYLVNYQNQLVTFNVISSSSKFIIIEQNNKEERIAVNDLQPIAKLLSPSFLYTDKNYYLEGIKL